MAVLHPNKEEFEELSNEKGLLLVDFFATWCGPCRILAPTIEELSENYSEGVKIAKIDIDENEELAILHNIQAVPTIILFKEGKELERFTGVASIEKLQEMIERNK